MKSVQNHGYPELDLEGSWVRTGRLVALLLVREKDRFEPRLLLTLLFELFSVLLVYWVGLLLILVLGLGFHVSML